MEGSAEKQLFIFAEEAAAQSQNNVEGKATEEASRRVFQFKLLKSTCLMVTWIGVGLYSGITGPTVPDFCERLHTDYDSIGFALGFRGAARMVGSVICGYLRDRLSGKGDLIIGVGNSMCVLMWKDKAGLPVHLMHFGFGVGAMISPLIARPFLSVHQQVNTTSLGPNTTTSTGLMTTNITSELKDITVKVSQIEIPYAIIAVFVLLVSLVYFGLFLYKPSQRLTKYLGSQSYKNPFSAPFLQDRPCSAVSIISLIFLFYLLNSCIERALVSFLFTYAVESDIGFNKGEAAYLNTVYYACYAGGRVVMGLLALKVSVKYLVFTEIYIMSASTAVITFFKSDRKLIIWVFASIQGFFFGPIFPSGMAWVDRYVPLYGLVAATFDVGNGIGGFFSNWLSGYLISTAGPHALLFLTFTASCCMCLVVVLAQISGAVRGDRHYAFLLREKIVV